MANWGAGDIRIAVDACGVCHTDLHIPDFQRAEYALIIRSDLQHLSLGTALLSAILAHARQRGAQEAWGDVLIENVEELKLVAAMGATCANPEGPRALMRTMFDLRKPAGTPAA